MLDQTKVKRRYRTVMFPSARRQDPHVSKPSERAEARKSAAAFLRRMRRKPRYCVYTFIPGKCWEVMSFGSVLVPDDAGFLLLISDDTYQDELILPAMRSLIYDILDKRKREE